jgi:hypothetical protein
MRRMRISKPIAISIGLVVVIGGSIILRLWWASYPPKLPKNLRANSVWIDGRALPFPYKLTAYFKPRGAWISCWLDTQRDVDRCQFTDYRGMVFYQNDYTSCDEKPPVPDARLQLRDHDQSTASIFLLDRTILWSASECEIQKRSRKLEWCPLCKEPWPNLKQ